MKPVITLASILEAWPSAVLIAALVIIDDLAVLSRGPPSDPAVVTVGVAKLFNIELEVEK